MKKNTQKNTPDFVVCYTTIDGSRLFACFNDTDYYETGEFNANKFKMLYPDTHILAVFKANDNIFDKSLQERNNFINNCRNYGFEPNDYHRLVNDNFGQPKYLFSGFLPRNTKYKALLFNRETGNYIRATLGYVERNMIFTPQEV